MGWKEYDGSSCAPRADGVLGKAMCSARCDVINLSFQLGVPRSWALRICQASWMVALLAAIGGLGIRGLSSVDTRINARPRSYAKLDGRADRDAHYHSEYRPSKDTRSFSLAHVR